METKATKREAGANRKKPVFRGVVVSTKMKDTAVVVVQSFKKHPKYRKFLRRSSRFKVHDAGNTVKEGESVSFIECRPVSKGKRFTLIKNANFRMQNDSVKS